MCDISKDSDIIVAIYCLTYNHEPYIRDCLDGFVMQKTNFKFVAIVHDDASTDKTADIIREYEAKYPDIIKPIYETENQYSKHDGSLDRIMDAAIDVTGAKYVAMCEGDDYWTDPLKLQKQVDFLDEHNDYCMCFHSASIKNEAGAQEILKCTNINDKEYFINDIFPGWVIPTASVLYKTKMINQYPSIIHQEWVLYEDIVIFLKCFHLGRVWGMSEKMSVYRMTANGFVLSSRNDSLHFEKLCRHYKCLMINFPKLNKKWPCSYIATFYYSQFRQLGNIFFLLRAFAYNPMYVTKKLLRIRVNGTY